MSTTKNNRDKIKRTSLYQDYENGGLRMIDIEIVIKALKPASIPRLLKNGNLNWKTGLITILGNTAD